MKSVKIIMKPSGMNHSGGEIQKQHRYNSLAFEKTEICPKIAVINDVIDNSK